MGSWDNSKAKGLIARHKKLIPKIDTKNSQAIVVFERFLEVFENISQMFL